MDSRYLTTTSNDGFMNFHNIDSAMKWAELICKSSLVPKEFRDSPANVLIALQFGMELGLKPMQALNGMMVVNGKPAIWGDVLLAVCMRNPKFEDCIETFNRETMTATCVVKRTGRQPVTVEYSKADAEKAGHLKKDGPWRAYPERMLKARARTYALRDMFPDSTKGIMTPDEVIDELVQEVDKTTGEILTHGSAELLKSKFKPFAVLEGATDEEIVVKPIEKVNGDTLHLLFKFYEESEVLAKKIDYVLGKHGMTSIKELSRKDAEKLIDFLEDKYEEAMNLHQAYADEAYVNEFNGSKQEAYENE